MTTPNVDPVQTNVQEKPKPSEWWRGAVIYQVYPRSFQDSNDDGIGDLPGLIQRLPYIAGLGVDALWVSPFFKSPQRDYGYDVSDYRDIDPMFGTLADCDLLIAEAHKLGLKVIFDIVLSHSSDQHPWFQDSRRRRNGKEGWYVWADPKEDGSPPNNWVSLFGGSAWAFDPLRGQYYLHNFLTEQPDLNFHNPDVQDAMLDVARFWLDRGVDGFRLDVVNFYFHDDELRDNPPRPKEMGYALQYEHPDPYSMQLHMYDKSQPENLPFIERFRALADSYGDKFLIGEIGDDRQIQRMAEYTRGPSRLHTAYCFAFLSGTDVKLTPDYIRKAVEEEIAGGESWPCWAFSNHDVPRAVTRLGAKNIADPAWPKLLLALLLSLRGSLCLYQGEELGLPEANVPYDSLRDPWGRRVWPIWQGRDGCRTPMPWNDALTHYGFTGADTQPWLPAAPEHQNLSVAAQEEREESTLHFLRRFMKFRREHPAVVTGEIAFRDAPDGVLVFTRGTGDRAFLCVFNLGDAKAHVPIAAHKRADADIIAVQADVSADDVSLEPLGFAVLPVSGVSISRAKPKSFWTKALRFLGSRKGS